MLLFLCITLFVVQMSGVGQQQQQQQQQPQDHQQLQQQTQQMQQNDKEEEDEELEQQEMLGENELPQSNVKELRYRKTMIALEKAGLLDLTLKISELMKQNEALQKDIDTLEHIVETTYMVVMGN